MKKEECVIIIIDFEQQELSFLLMLMLNFKIFLKINKKYNPNS